MPRSKMPNLSPMEIKPVEDGYLKQDDYLNKPEKPNALKSLQKAKREEESVEPVENSGGETAPHAVPVEKPVKKKRVMS